MAMFGYLGLGFPDIDLLALPVLHHRSIVTHSILLPVIFLLVRNSSVQIGACGFILGLSIHLSADILSRPMGFGMVWFPWPIKASLGPLSPVWLAANALVGLVWAKVLLFKLDQRNSIRIYVTIATILALSYAGLHERSMYAFFSFACLFGTGFLIAQWMTKQRWFIGLPQRTKTQQSKDVR